MDISLVDGNDGFQARLTDYEEDQEFRGMYRTFDDIWPTDPKERRKLELLRPHFDRINGKLMYLGKLCVPRKAIPELLHLAHDTKVDGHFGFKKTLRRLEKYHWKHKTRDVKRYCDGCRICQQHKDDKGKTINDPTALELPERRWGMVSTDFITQLPKTEDGWDAITTWVDRHSRRVHFIPSKGTDTAEDTERAFFKVIFPQHGLPDAIISDRDPKFGSKFRQELMSMCGVKLKMSSVRHPQTDGASVVMNRVVENYLRCFCSHKQNDWDILLPVAEFAYNSAVSEDLGVSPFELDLGWVPSDPLSMLIKTSPVQAAEDFKAELESTFEDARYAHSLVKARQTAEAGLISKLPTYLEGDEAWVSRKLWSDHYSKTRPSAKLSARWFGPFKILKVIGRNAIRL